MNNLYFFIGYPKTASTFLFNKLKKDERIQTSSSKDTHLFSNNFKKSYLDNLKNNLNKNKPNAEFDHDLVFYMDNIIHINTHIPGTKFVLAVRDYESHIISNFLYQVSQGKFNFNKEDFKKFTIDEKENFQNIDHIKFLNENLRSEDLLIIKYELLQKNPQEFLDKIYKFMGLEDVNYEHNNIIVNQARLPKYNKIIYVFLRKIGNQIKKISPKTHNSIKNNKFISSILFKEIKNKNIMRDITLSYFDSDFVEHVKRNQEKLNELL